MRLWGLGEPIYIVSHMMYMRGYLECIYTMMVMSNVMCVRTLFCRPRIRV